MCTLDLHVQIRFACADWTPRWNPRHTSQIETANYNWSCTLKLQLHITTAIEHQILPIQVVKLELHIAILTAHSQFKIQKKIRDARSNFISHVRNRFACAGKEIACIRVLYRHVLNCHIKIFMLFSKYMCNGANKTNKLKYKIYKL